MIKKRRTRPPQPAARAAVVELLRAARDNALLLHSSERALIAAELGRTVVTQLPVDLEQIVPPADAVTSVEVPSEWLTPRDHEQQYQIKVATQGTFRHRRQIPFVRLGCGKLIRYRRSEIEAWLESNAVPVVVKPRSEP